MAGGDYNIFGWFAMLGFFFGTFGSVWIMSHEEVFPKGKPKEARKGRRMKKAA
jgi:hypothetical protein